MTFFRINRMNNMAIILTSISILPNKLFRLLELLSSFMVSTSRIWWIPPLNRFCETDRTFVIHDYYLEAHSIMMKVFTYKCSSLQWLMVVSLAVLYNVVFVLGRAVFWELNNSVPVLWWTLDYACDVIYILDILVRAHEGKCYQFLYIHMS